MRLFLAFVLAFLASHAFGDGGYIPRDIAQDPSIPYQRAILKFRDGQETLIVESFLQGKGGDYAWIVPVPVEPTVIEPVSPGTVETLAAVVRPHVASWGSVFTIALFVFIFVFAFLMLSYAMGKQVREPTLFKAYTGSTLAGAIAATACAIFFPVFGGGPFYAIGGHDWGTIGSYHVQCVPGERAKRWLHEQGFKLSETEQSAIDSYIRDSWRFVTIKLEKHEGLAESPHPLKLVFDSSKAVYPMRLTMAMGKPLRLDLFVIANGTPVYPGLRRWGSAEPTVTSEPYRLLHEGWAAPDQTWKPTNHPGIAPLLWVGATITRLHGEIVPSGDLKDFHLSIGLPDTSLVEVTDRNDIGNVVFLFFCAWLAALATVSAHQKIRHEREFGQLPAGTVSLVTAAVLLSAMLFLSRLDLVPTVRSNLLDLSSIRMWTMSAVEALAAEPVEDDPRAAILDFLGDKKAKLIERDVPSGMTIEKRPEAWRFTVYDRVGNPMWKDVPVAQNDGGQ